MIPERKLRCSAEKITLHCARNCSDVLEVPGRKIGKGQHKMPLFCIKS